MALESNHRRPLKFVTSPGVRLEAMGTALVEACPLCGSRLRRELTCTGCGLWWVKSTRNAVLQGVGETSAVSLRSPISIFACAVFSGFAVLGWGALFVTLDSVLAHPSSGASWLALLIALPLGGTVGAVCCAALVSSFVHWLIPARLVCGDAGMRVRLWQTWSGVWASFRWRRAFIPRHQLRGITFHLSQGGRHQLFIVLASGWSFGTGWEGSEAAYFRHARALAAPLRPLH